MKSKRALDISALPPIENLKIGSFGYRCPEPLFKYGPVIHKGYYLCYILEGKGCFQYGSHYYSLSKGQGFLIEPDVIISCQAEKSRLGNMPGWNCGGLWSVSSCIP